MSGLLVAAAQVCSPAQCQRTNSLAAGVQPLGLGASLPDPCWLCPQLVEAGGKARFDLRSRETVLIHHVFGGYTRNQVACRRCGLGPAGLCTGWLLALLVLGQPWLLIGGGGDD